MIFQAPPLDAQEQSVIAEIERLRERLRHVSGEGHRRWMGILRRNTFARAVRGSNSIEGYNVTIDDAVAAVEGEEPLIDPKTETWLAVTGYRDAMTFVLQKVDDQSFGYSPDLLKSLHYMMLKYDITKNPGRWRPGYVYVREESTGNIVYEGPPVENVIPLIEELLAELNSGPGQQPLITAAMSHLNLVMIHPFSDGNGRMARCLQTLVLSRHGVLGPVFSSIEEYLGRNTQNYYEVLAGVGAGSWHPERDTRDWIRFCLKAHYRQATTLLRRVRIMERLYEELVLIVRKAGLDERAVLGVLDAATGQRVRNPTYRAAADVTRIVAGRDLSELVKIGLLEPHGEKRGRYYTATPRLKEIYVLAAVGTEPKMIADPFTLELRDAPTAEQPPLPGMKDRVR
jgi:Fic family protein